ncbi:hypothetical protein PI126_g5809 [Phytophthora idaei]|nr:hypothetical protein PI126_g5809 [Phytophthora idaei]
MSEIPGVRKHVNSQASGETQRRRIARGASSDSQPTDNALSSSLGGIVELKRAWSKLRKEGWTSRLPRLGLDNRYIRPGENPKGVEGVDFLVGEEGVLQFISSRADKAVGAITLGTPEYSNDTCIRVATNDVCVRFDLTAAVDADAGGRGSGGRGRGAARRVQGCDQDRGVVRELGAVFGIIEVASLNTARTAQSNDSSSNDSIGLERACSTLVVTPPPLLQYIYVHKLVAVSPEKEPWMKSTVYKVVGTAYIMGRVCRRMRKGKKTSLFQVRWIDLQFQHAVEYLSVGKVQDDIEYYRTLVQVKTPDWRVLTQPDSDDDMDIDDVADLEVGAVYEEYEFPDEHATSLEEVEAIKHMRFDPTGYTEGSKDLFTYSDGSSKTRLCPEYRHIFEHSASSCFFAYIPLYFWRQVLYETNEYAIAKNIRTSSPFTLPELMTFFGILFYMALADKGEFSNYWGEQPEDRMFGGTTTALDAVMSLNRFKLLRRCLSFNAAPPNPADDAAARIRPLLNLLKVTGDKYVVVGRNVALDEASVRTALAKVHI